MFVIVRQVYHEKIKNTNAPELQTITQLYQILIITTAGLDLK